MNGVLKENSGSDKVSASRFVMLAVLALGTLAFVYIAWRIGYKGDTYAMYGDLIKEWKQFLVWVGVVPYSANQAAKAIKSSRNPPAVS